MIPCQASEGFFANAQNDSPLFVILRAEPEGSHAQLAEGFFADAQNDNKKSQNSKLKTQSHNSKLKTFYCVILRAEPEGSHAQLAEGFFADAQNDDKKVLRMTIIKSKVKHQKRKKDKCSRNSQIVLCL